MSLNKTFFKGPGGVVVPNLSSDPVTGSNGEIYYNTTLGKFRFYEDGVWGDVASAGTAIETRSITAMEESNKYLTLSETPIAEEDVILMIAGAPSQYYGLDYEVILFAFFTGQVAGMTTDVTITADNPGVIGNSVTLMFDGLIDIDDAIIAWNFANPNNTITLTSGNGAQVPDNLETITLAQGNTLTWDSLALDGILAENDNLTIQYLV